MGGRERREEGENLLLGGFIFCMVFEKTRRTFKISNLFSGCKNL
jgi:hypothetical protein